MRRTRAILQSAVLGLGFAFALALVTVLPGAFLVQAQQTSYSVPTATIAAGTAGSFAFGGQFWAHAATPTIVGTSCFTSGTATTIANNGSAVIQLTVGGTPANTCVITFPLSTTGWDCTCTDITTNSTAVDKCKQTASTTNSCTIGIFTDVSVAGPPVAADKILVNAFAF